MWFIILTYNCFLPKNRIFPLRRTENGGEMWLWVDFNRLKPNRGFSCWFKPSARAWPVSSSRLLWWRMLFVLISAMFKEAITQPARTHTSVPLCSTVGWRCSRPLWSASLGRGAAARGRCCAFPAGWTALGRGQDWRTFLSLNQWPADLEAETSDAAWNGLTSACLMCVCSFDQI